MAVDQGQAEGEGLGQADHGVVDGGVAVGVEFTHDFADDAGTFDVTLVWGEPHVSHHVEDTALDGFEAVAGVGQGAGVDDRVGVFQEAGFHLLGDVDIQDFFLDVAGVVVLGHWAAPGHALPHCLVSALGSATSLPPPSVETQRLGKSYCGHKSPPGLALHPAGL